MGGFIDKLTKPGLDTTGVPSVGANENSGQSSSPGGVKFFNSPDERAMNFADVSRSAAQPSIANVNGTIAPDGSEKTSTSYDTPQVNLPRFLKPTYKEATTDQNGLPVANTPATTKLGKFMQ